MRLFAYTLFAFASLSCAAAAQEREWLLDAADEDVFLVFGVAESDDVGVSLWCKINSGKVKIFFPDASPDLEAEAKADLRIVIASKEYVFSGTTSANDVSGVTSIEMELPVDDPVIVAMQEADRFAAIIAGHTTTYPLIEAGVDNLIRLCKAK